MPPRSLYSFREAKTDILKGKKHILYTISSCLNMTYMGFQELTPPILRPLLHCPFFVHSTPKILVLFLSANTSSLFRPNGICSFFLCLEWSLLSLFAWLFPFHHRFQVNREAYLDHSKSSFLFPQAYLHLTILFLS